MNENFQRVQAICIDHATQLSEVFGLSDAMARIVALLYMSSESLSIPMICDRLTLTKGTVSLYLRMLEQRKIVTRDLMKRKGRQKYYEINARLWNDLLEDIRTKIERRYRILEDAIDKSLTIIDKDKKTYTREDQLIAGLLEERLDKIRKINELTRSVFSRIGFDDGTANDPSVPLKNISLT